MNAKADDSKTIPTQHINWGEAKKIMKKRIKPGLIVPVEDNGSDKSSGSSSASRLVLGCSPSGWMHSKQI